MTTTTATTTAAILITPLRPFAGVDAISGVSSSGSGASSSIDTTFGFVGITWETVRVLRERHEPGAIQPTHSNLGPRGKRYGNEGVSPVIRESSRPQGRVDRRVPHRRRGPGRFNPETPG